MSEKTDGRGTGHVRTMTDTRTNGAQRRTRSARQNRASVHERRAGNAGCHWAAAGTYAQTNGVLASPTTFDSFAPHRMSSHPKSEDWIEDPTDLILARLAQSVRRQVPGLADDARRGQTVALSRLYYRSICFHVARPAYVPRILVYMMTVASRNAVVRGACDTADFDDSFHPNGPARFSCARLARRQIRAPISRSYAYGVASNARPTTAVAAAGGPPSIKAFSPAKIKLVLACRAATGGWFPRPCVPVPRHRLGRTTWTSSCSHPRPRRTNSAATGRTSRWTPPIS